MKFQNVIYTAANAVPPPYPVPPTGLMATAMALVNSDTTKTGTGHNYSGQSAMILPGMTDEFTISLKQLIVSWNGVVTPGQLEIQWINDETIMIEQTAPDGNLIIPCFDQVCHLGDFGLRALNNSIGGEYAVVAYYKVEVI